MFKKKNTRTDSDLRVVKTAGYKANRAVKRDKSFNRRAGLHDKLNGAEGEVRVKRRKPLALKHVRRMRKVGAVAAVGVVGAVGIFGVGFLMPPKAIQLDGEYATVCYVAPTDGTKPTDHTLVENVGYMNYVLQNQAFWSSRARTDVDAVALGIPAKQAVDNYKQYYNGVLISADCSFSSVAQSLQYGEQFCQVENAVLFRKSTSNSTSELEKGMDAPWSDGSATGMTIKAFKRNRGLPPKDFSVYVLNEKTVANAYDYTVVDNYDGTYSMSLTLNTNTGVDETSADYYYRLQMKVNGNLNDLPTIYSTTLTYTFDADWRILKLEVEDSYTAKAMGMNSDCTSHTTTIYSYSEDDARNSLWNDYFKSEYDRLKDTFSDDEVIDVGNEPNPLGYLSGAFASVITDGAIFKLDLKLDNLDLGGVVCVDMADGELSGLTAKLGDFLVWLDGGTLYIDGGANIKYSLDTGALSGGCNGDNSGSGGDITELLDVDALMEQLTTGEFTVDPATGNGSLKTDLEIFGLKISLDFEFLNGENGVALDYVSAEIPVGGKTVAARLCFGSESDRPVLPADTSAYKDILNGEITLDVNLTLYTGAVGENSEKQDEVTLDGKVGLVLSEGALTEIRADFGDLRVYYEFDTNTIYIKLGETKMKLDFDEIELDSLSSLSFSESGAAVDLSTIVADILKNIATTDKTISASADLSVLDSIIPVWADISLDGGISVKAGLSVFGIDAEVGVSISDAALDGLTEAEKKDYINPLDNAWKIIESVIGDKISATVAGGIYAYDDEKKEYATSYTFDASAELDKTNADDLYVRFALNLDATAATKDDLYFDLLIKDKNVYVYISKYANNGATEKPAGYNPMRLYMPLDELENIFAMVGAMTNFDGHSFGNNEELAAAFNQIYGMLDGILDIDARLGDTATKFASLGESLIPQIFSSIVTHGESGEGGEDSGKFKLDLSEKYVSSISTKSYGDGKSSLIAVIDSALAYGIDGLDNLRVEISKNKDLLLCGVDLVNVYFGNKAESKLNMSLDVSKEFEKAATPDKSDYFDLSGIDGFLKTFVNSATHETTEAEYEAGIKTDYVLNKEYYINGNIGINFLGWDKLGVTVEVKNFFVSINDDNTVEFNVSLYHDSFIGVISEKADVDITVKDEMVFMRKSTNGGKTYNYRIMTADAFLDDIFNQLQYIMGFSDLIMNQMKKGNGGDGVTFDDYGDYLSKIISNYSSAENDGSATWSVGIVKDFINGFVGMGLLSADINAEFKASRDTVSELYKFDSLTISSTMFSVIKFTANLNYCNAQYVWSEGQNLSGNVVRLDSDESYGIDGYSWVRILGGTKLAEIEKTVNWSKLISETSGSVYLNYDGSNLKIGTLKYEYATDLENSSFAPLDAEQTILYNGAKGSRYTYYNAPSLRDIPAINSAKLIWQVTGDPLLVRAVYERYNITVESSVEIAGMTQDGDVYKTTTSYLVTDTVDFNYRPAAASPLYNFVGFFDVDGNEVTEWTVTGDAVIYAKWTGKRIDITYSSDVPVLGGVTDAGNISVVSGSVKFGEDDSLITPVAGTEGVSFLGWFVESNGSYLYIADSTALKNYLADNYFDDEEKLNEQSVAVTLWAVWYDDVATGEITGATHKQPFLNNWYIEGYVNSPLHGKSAEIANKAGINLKAEVKYGAYKNESSSISDLDYNTWRGITLGATFTKDIVGSTKGTSYGTYAGCDIRITISFSGNSKTVKGKIMRKINI